VPSDSLNLRDVCLKKVVNVQGKPLFYMTRDFSYFSLQPIEKAAFYIHLSGAPVFSTVMKIASVSIFDKFRVRPIFIMTRLQVQCVLELPDEHSQSLWTNQAR